MLESHVFLQGPFKVDFKKALPTEAVRRARGLEARARVSRRELGVWEPADEVRDPVDVVMAVAKPRQQRLIPLRTARMAVSPFTFYRGAAQLMAADLGTRPNTGIHAQLCGDAHLSNFGMYASRERAPVFDINDFDETGQGPWEWDLKRLTTSFVLASRDNGLGAHAEGAVRATVGAYVAALNEMAGLGWLERRYRMVRADRPVVDGVVWRQSTAQHVNMIVSKAAKKTQAWTVAKYTEVVDGVIRLRTAPPVITAVGRRTAAAVTAALRQYLESLSVERRAYLAAYHVVDVAHKVVGVGSVGTYDYIVLLMGDGEHDELLLQVKEAEPSAVKTALGEKPLLANGERVVVGSWLMQSVSDPFLGWTQMHGRTFYVRQLKDMKGSVDPATLDEDFLPAYGTRCGYTLGLAHSRAGDPDVILGYVGKGAALANALWGFSEAYADQTERDYGRFIEAIHDGRLKVAELAPAAATAKPAKVAKAKAKAAKAEAPGDVAR
ncbi:MAG: DUF2252 domain-containing protein [Actinobacteria bacterium]|nr:DUF2252 domain-containing protein [Actinomycetota bacterium]